MDTRIRVLIAGLLALAGVGFLMARQVADDPPEPSPPVATSPRPAPTPPEGGLPRPAPPPDTPVVHEAAGRPVPVTPEDPDRAAPGRAFRSDRPHPNSTAGDIETLPPANDPEVWRQRREAMAVAWERSTLQVAGRWADEVRLDPDERQAVLDALRLMHARMASVRHDIEAGRATPAVGRDALKMVRIETASAVEAAVGPEQAESLRVRLRKEVRGGGY